MSELQAVVTALTAGLTAVAFFMLKSWYKSWETKLDQHENRLGKHDVQIATVTSDMKHILDGIEDTRQDVKELLRNQNVRRITSSVK